ncbi:MAG: TolC family protein [Planctomycetota bacterium]
MPIGSRLCCACILLSACAVPKYDDFPYIQRTLAERDLPDVHWNLGTPEDQIVAGRVTALLQTDLTVGSAVQIALLNNRRLQGLYERFGIAQAEVAAASHLRNPELLSAIQIADHGSIGLESFVMRPFLDIFAAPTRRRVAEHTFAATRARVTGAIIAFVAEVQAAFYSYQATQQIVALRQSALGAAETAYNRALAQHGANETSDLDLARERAFLEQARLDVASVEATSRQHREDLNALLGLWANRTEWRAVATLPPVPADDTVVEGIETRAIGRSLDLETQRCSIEAAGQMLELARGTSFFADTQLGTSAGREVVDGFWRGGLAIAVPIPIWNQGQTRNAAALAAFRRLQERYASSAVEIRARARALTVALDAARAQESFHREVLVPLCERVLDEIERASTESTAIERLRARQAEVDARRAQIAALRSYWLLRVELDQLLNGSRRVRADSALDAADAALALPAPAV